MFADNKFHVKYKFFPEIFSQTCNETVLKNTIAAAYFGAVDLSNVYW